MALSRVHTSIKVHETKIKFSKSRFLFESAPVILLILPNLFHQYSRIIQRNQENVDDVFN